MKQHESEFGKSLSKDLVSYKFKSGQRESENNTFTQRCVFTIERMAELDSEKVTPIKLIEHHHSKSSAKKTVSLKQSKFDFLEKLDLQYKS